MPYTIEMLATLTNHKVNTIKKTLVCLEEFGAIEKLENDTYNMTGIETLIGKSSSSYEPKQKEKSQQKKTEVDTIDTTKTATTHNNKKHTYHKNKSNSSSGGKVKNDTSTSNECEDKQISFYSNTEIEKSEITTT